MLAGAAQIGNQRNMNKQTVTIEVDMFGRETSVEIGFLDVKKL